MADVVDRIPGMSAAKPNPATGAFLGRITRSVCRRAWRAASLILWGDLRGIDESAFPSGYATPHRRGSRMVRNLWHLPL